jgi:8-oxo-dGTP pyrophosphatase MutT (NUDIX family)
LNEDERMTDASTLPYRPGAGVMLVNREGKIFVAQRIDSTLEAWQMPQGGLDKGEDPEDGALRELEEETGIPRDKVEVLARAPDRSPTISRRTSSASSGRASGAARSSIGSSPASSATTRT